MTAITEASHWGAMFRNRARELGLTHREVDELAEIADGYFSKVCAGRKIPGGDVILRICNALRIELRPLKKN
jgi:Helix-turn-helix domain